MRFEKKGPLQGDSNFIDEGLKVVRSGTEVECVTDLQKFIQQSEVIFVDLTEKEVSERARIIAREFVDRGYQSVDCLDVAQRCDLRVAASAVQKRAQDIENLCAKHNPTVYTKANKLARIFMAADKVLSGIQSTSQMVSLVTDIGKYEEVLGWLVTESVSRLLLIDKQVFNRVASSSRNGFEKSAMFQDEHAKNLAPIGRYLESSNKDIFRDIAHIESEDDGIGNLKSLLDNWCGIGLDSVKLNRPLIVLGYDNRLFDRFETVYNIELEKSDVGLFRKGLAWNYVDSKVPRYEDKKQYLSFDLCSVLIDQWDHRVVQEFMQEVVSESQSPSIVYNSLRAFVEILNSNNLKFDKLVIWGKLKKRMVAVSRFLCKAGKQVVWFVPEGYENGNITGVDLIKFEDTKKYELGRPKVASSVAYKAQQEINDKLFDGSTPGIYRYKQYKTCDTIRLNTTFSEMITLMNVENQIRPQFYSNKDSVRVANIFAKVDGVSKDYWQSAKDIVDKCDIVVWDPSELKRYYSSGAMRVAHTVGVNDTTFKEQKLMMRTGHVCPVIIMEYKTYPYKNFNKDVQYHMADCIRKVMDSSCILPVWNDNTRSDAVFNVCLNLTKEITQIIQCYDFVKRAPKICIFVQDENMLSFEDVVFLKYLYEIGWDVVVMVPTCYEVFGDYLAPDDYQVHRLGDPVFDMKLRSKEDIESRIEKKGFWRDFWKDLGKRI